MQPPYVSIVILAKNAGSSFSNTLRSIFSSITDFVFEVILIDSDSTDNTREIASGYPIKLVKIPSTEFGHGKTRNLGAALAQGELLVYLTQDAILASEETLQTIVLEFADNEVAGAYGRQLPNLDSSPLEKYFLEYAYPDKRIVKTKIDPENCSLSDIFFSNVFSTIRKSDLLQTPFNESLIMSEDQEWAKQVLIQRKKIIYCHKATVVHSHKYSIIELFKRNFDSGYSLRGVVNVPVVESICFELNFLLSGFVYMLRQRYVIHMLIFPFYEFVRLVAFSIGFWGDKLPKGLKRLLSKHKYHWDTA